MAIRNAEDEVTPPVMLAFYRRLYPYKSIYNWLNHDHTPTKLFTHREFAFSLPEDVYLRYQSFVSPEELKKQVLAQNPSRFEIGPIYSARPRDRKTVRPSAFQPLLRELVFDIDLTDYDSIRTCCSKANICKLCWKFIAVAVKVLDEGIRDQFGYQHLLWVYSGRRGIHLWISDKDAMELTDDQRRALVNWMTIIHGGKEMHKKVNVRAGTKPLPPSLDLALQPLRYAFPEIILEDQDCFSSEEGAEALLNIFPNDIQKSIREKWDTRKSRSSASRWNDIVGLGKSKITKSGKGDEKAALVAAYCEDIVLQYTYPRLDAEVSKHRNHLLKAPFCVHPSTGRVCVPIDPAHIDDFDPEKVPTVNQLLRELAQVSTTGTDGADGSTEQHHSDWEKTSLKSYVDILDRHALSLMEESRRGKRGGTGTSTSPNSLGKTHRATLREPALGQGRSPHGFYVIDMTW